MDADDILRLAAPAAPARARGGGLGARAAGVDGDDILRLARVRAVGWSKLKRKA